MTALFIDLFDDIAQQRGAHPAIVTDGYMPTSYAALRTQALRIAAHIPRGPDGRVVAIHIDKSTDYLAAVLGCWYARAAFLPLDTALPVQRRAVILDEAQPVCLLSTTALECTIPVVNIATLPDCRFTARPSAGCDTTAYVIYTSGSTGAPKGVVVSHRGLVPVLQEQIKLFELNVDSRSLFYLSTSFDASISDFGTALLAGATLYIESGSAIDTAANLARVLRERGITYADLPPALLRVLDPAHMPDTLRTICIGGEVCPPAVVRQWAQYRRIVCVYGPTEATICTSASMCDPTTWQTPLIGDPLPGVTYAIFDSTHQICDDGELYIAGPHLADGYVAQPELTAQKFITLHGQRWYRTGDHVRSTSDGIEFIGRIDRQFKWRGQLIEPEEIEQTLTRITGITRAALVHDKDAGHERLIAHIESEQIFTIQDIQKLLSHELPSWMIPTNIVRHAEMPLTATGKINRMALTLHTSATDHVPEEAFVPTSAHEQRLLACWQRVLRQDIIAAHAPFSSLGGDSFAVLQLLLDAEKEGLVLSPDFVARHTTIAAQARHLQSDSLATLGWQDAKALRTHVMEKFPISPAQSDNAHAGDILFTGATGFLGHALLLRLLEQTDQRIHVVLRAANPVQGLQRLNLPPHMVSRIHVICGDITQEHLGLTPETWAMLTDDVGTIVHCAATVNMTQAYQTLEDANVRAVHSLLRLAAQGRAKHIHHASTLSVFVATDCNTGIAREDNALADTHKIYGGYAQSKWAAEVLLHAARHQGHIITLHRLGLITGDSVTGAFSTHDFLRTFMQGVISLGHIPADEHSELFVDVTPVDYAADMMMCAIRNNVQGCVHIANTRGFSWPQIMQALIRQGYPLSTLDARTWDDWLAQRRAVQPLSAEESAAVMGMCRALPAPAFEHHRAMDLFQATDIAFDMSHLKKIPGWRLAPAADNTLLDLYIRAFHLRPISAKNLAIA